MFPSSGTVFVVYADEVVDDLVELLFVFGSNFYVCFFKNGFQVPEVACHSCMPLELSVLCCFVNFVLGVAVKATVMFRLVFGLWITVS